jgi:hypothetical protein
MITNIGLQKNTYSTGLISQYINGNALFTNA